MYKLYIVHQTKCGCYKAKTPIKPIGILVHSTGADNPNLRRYVDAEEPLGKNPNGNHWNRPELTVQVHAFIGKDKEGEVAVAETLPKSIACWGCGRGKKGSYNYEPTPYIQFEICEQQGDKAYFDKVFAVAAEYCADLCRNFGWDETRITSHGEAAKAGYASNHGDPDHWLARYGRDMNWFRSEVSRRLSAAEPIAPDTAAAEYTPPTAEDLLGITIPQSAPLTAPFTQGSQDAHQLPSAETPDTPAAEPPKECPLLRLIKWLGALFKKK